MERRTAVITGGTSGIGAAFSSHFASEGYDLIITGHPGDKPGINLEPLRQSYNVSIDLYLADFADEDDILKVEGLIRQNQNIEVLVNNAGFVFYKPFWENKVEDLEGMIKTHISAPVRFIKAVLPSMISKRRGIIINLSSISSFLPIPRDSMYSATKLFINSFMESLHISVRDKGVKVQVLCPGFVHSNFHKRAGVERSEIRRSLIIKWMQPDEVVRISVRALETKNKVIVIPGFRNKLIRFLVTCLPRRIYYSFAAKYFQ